jgi:amidase
MTSGGRLAGRPAAEIAALVQAKEVSPEQVVFDHLAAIAERDQLLNAFQVVLREEALAEARTLAEQWDLDQLPLAGVPVAVKDDVDVAGAPTRWGSVASPVAPAGNDDEIAARLRAAGAIIIGKTRVPELMAWPYTETLAFGATRNPWHPAYTPGGSSGGAGAAVAAGLVPIAVGSDGLGSIRIPAACCGLFGIKPGKGVVPRPSRAGQDWFGLSEHGPIATTVEDAALALDVLAGRDDLRDPAEPAAAMRIAVSTRPPLPMVIARRYVRAALGRVTQALRDEGHAVVVDGPDYPTEVALHLTQRWLGGIAADTEGMPWLLLEPSTRTSARLGQLLQRVAPVDPADADAYRETVNMWFQDYDALMLPSVPQPPLRVGQLHGRPWLWRYLASIPYAAFHGPWNLAGFPAAVVPAGVTRRGLPVGVQLVARRGGEATLLSLARQIERLRPWPRLAPRR